MASFAVAGATTSVATGAIFARRLSYDTSFSSPLLAKRKQTATKIGTNEVRCSSIEHNKRAKVVAATTMVLTTFGALNVANPVALALVDERMSTEGTGLSLGLSNNLLGWILLGVFGVIWSLYTVYTSTLDEDDDSGLSL